MTAHKHAVLMMQYAEDAAKTDKTWELWEYKDIDNKWINCTFHPSWHETSDYRRKPVKWQPVGGEWWVGSDGKVEEGYTDKEMKEFGLERPTKEQAQRAAVEMRRFNRLLALRDELCGDEVEDDVHFVIFQNIDGVYFVGYSVQSNTHMGAVRFTSKEKCYRACDMLNSGEVEL